MCSDCPSVCGWNAVLIFCCMPVALYTTLLKWLANLGSQSNIICLGIPNQGNKCWKYLIAIPWPSMVLLQEINFAAFKHPWSTIVSIVSYLFKGGRSVIRSMDTY